MKAFSQEEQEIVRRLVCAEGFSRNFVNLIESSKLSGVRVVVDKKTLAAKFLFQSYGGTPSESEVIEMGRRQKEITELIILYVGLFRYLERNDLAIAYEPVGASTDIVTFGMGAANMPCHEWTFHDKTIAGLISEYYHKEIIPSHSLRVLVGNNFLTEEELRFRAQMRATWSAIVISIAIGAIGIAASLYGLYAEESSLKQQIAHVKSSVLANENASIEQERSMRHLKSQVDLVSNQLETSKTEIIDVIEKAFDTKNN